MGTYSKARLPEPVVREIYNFALAMGTRARLVNTLAPGVRTGDTVSYTLTVTNLGKTHGVQPRGCLGGAGLGSRSQGCPRHGQRLSGSPASSAERP